MTTKYKGDIDWTDDNLIPKGPFRSYGIKKAYHFGKTYCYIIWENSKIPSWYAYKGNPMSREKFKIALKVMKTPLYKAIYE